MKWGNAWGTFCILSYKKYFLSLLYCIKMITIFLKVSIIVATWKHNKICFSVLFRQTEEQPTLGERWALHLCLRIHSCCAVRKTREGNRYTETRFTRTLIQILTNWAYILFMLSPIASPHYVVKPKAQTGRNYREHNILHCQALHFAFWI